MKKLGQLSSEFSLERETKERINQKKAFSIFLPSENTQGIGKTQGKLMKVLKWHLLPVQYLSVSTGASVINESFYQHPLRNNSGQVSM